MYLFNVHYSLYSNMQHMEIVKAEIVELCDIKTHLRMKAESLYINLSKHIYRGVFNFVMLTGHGEFL